MNKREAILFLEKKRDKAIGDMSFFGEGSRKGLMNEIRVNTYDIAINTLQQLDEPQVEKQEVSQEFADWVESVKEDYGNWQSWCVKEVAGMCWGNWLHANRNELDCLPHDGWAEEVSLDKEKHIKAIYDGYTVKPKRWVVKNEEGRYFVAFSKYAKTPFEGVFSASVTNLVTFDDKAKAEAVATLVEGSVEEV